MSEISENINNVLSLQGLDLTKHVFNHNSLSNFLIECRDEIEKLEAALQWIIEQEGQTAHPTVCAIIKTARKAMEKKND